jgi:hypothetical protein
MIGEAIITLIAAAAIVALRDRGDGLIFPEGGPVSASIEDANAEAWLARVATVRAEKPFEHLYREPAPAQGRHRGEEAPAEAALDSTAVIRMREVLAQNLDPYLAKLPGYRPRHEMPRED